MKKLLSISLLLLSTVLLNAQNNVWSLPPNYYKFNTNLPIPLPTNPNGYQGQQAQYCHNAMQDKNGNLLFFIVDGYVYDKNGETISKISSVSANYNMLGSTEVLILPDPSDCDKYYLILEGDNPINFQSFTTIVWYCVLDLTPDIYNPSGPYYPELSNALFLDGNVKNDYNSLAATNIKNGSRFLYMVNRDLLYKYKIDAAGLNLQTTYNYDANFTQWGSGLRSELEIIETTNSSNQPIYKIAHAYEGAGPKNIIYTAELDITTGDVIPGTEETQEYIINGSQNPVVHGLEFSKDGKKLYITHEKTTQYPSGIDYYVLGSGSAPQSLNIATDADFQFSQIELGKDDKLYFATDNRLATYDTQLNTWNNTALNINYNFNYAYQTVQGGATYGTKTYLLPDQIDGMDYAEHFTANLECCIDNTTFSTTTYSNMQSGTQNWTSINPFGNSSTITVQDELIIKTGADITATGLRFEFAPDAKLVVERGATFTIKNCTLTVNTECENAAMWNGVDVQGPSNNQQAVDAGRFIANNSLIEHAYWATHNFSTEKIIGTPGQFSDNGNRGGVIIATNTTFRNNHRAMVFFNFQNKNTLGKLIDDQSKFYNCTFKTEALLNKPSLTPTVIMAHLFGVQGVNFYGCDFTTGNIPTLAAHERGTGIASDNCLLTVTSLCSSCLNPDRSTFTDMTRGIEAYSNFTLRATKINNTDFNNVWRGIYLKSNELSTITNNTFDVASDNAWSQGYGLYLDVSKRYKVENNAFNTNYNGYCGVYVNNSGTENNEIYRNTFNNLVIGSQAAGSNGNRSTINGGLGLEFRCNTYTNIINADIYVSSGWIKPTHGNCINQLTPSNNQFSRTTAVGDFWQDPSVVDHVTYQYSQPNGYNINPIQCNCSGPDVNTFPTVCPNSVFNPSTSCPKRASKPIIVLKDDLAVEKTVIINLNGTVAAGDANALYTAIQTQSAGNVKNALMAASPYLSDDVLLTYIGSNAPHGNLQQVLIANSPLSQAVLNALQQSNLPKGIKTQITNAQAGTPAMVEIKSEIAYHKDEVRKIQDDVLRYILFEDDVVERYYEAIEFIKQENACIEKRCELISFYTVNEEYANAQQELSEIAQFQENADFVKLFSNIIQLEQATDAIEELITNIAIQQPIVEVAEMPIRKQETAMAEVLLKRSKLRTYQETIEAITLSSGARLMNQNNDDNKTLNSQLLTLNSVSVYPNPTSSEVNITHNLTPENGKVMFKVYNMLGVEVINETLTSTNNEVKVNNLKSGVYFYTITQSASGRTGIQTIKTDKLMVR